MEAIKLMHTAKMTRGEWEQARAELNGIGGSDAATILNVNDYKKPLRLYLEMRGEVERKKIDNMAVKMGHLLEPIVAQLFKEETGFTVRNCNYILQHKDNPYMFANIDREIITPEGRGVLEIKTTNEFLKDDWEGEFVPDPYLVQVQHYLAVTGYQFAYLAVLIGGRTYKHFYIKRDEEIIKGIEEAVNTFMHNVEHGIRPDIDGSSDANDLLSSLYPAAAMKEQEITLNNEIWQDLYKTRQLLKQQVKDIKGEIDEIDNKFKEVIGENSAATINNDHGEKIGAVTWKAANSTKIDYKKMKEEQPEFYAQFEEMKKRYSTETQTRRINYKKQKKD